MSGQLLSQVMDGECINGNGAGNDATTPLSTTALVLSANNRWLLLNEVLHGCIIYSQEKGRYFLSRSHRWVEVEVVQPLLEQGYLVLAGTLPNVYTLSEAGRHAWTQIPADLQPVIGRCDGCGKTTTVRPLLHPLMHAWWHMLCQPCQSVFIEEITGAPLTEDELEESDVLH